MIDDKEIDIAARAQTLSKHVNETVYFQLRSIEDFKDGAHWAIQEFLKDLWHPAEEEPKVGERVFTHNEDDDTYKVITWFTMWYTWDGYKDIDHIDKWLYIDDLLTKKGGEEK